MNGRKGEKYKVDLVGGDTTSSLTGLTIGVIGHMTSSGSGNFIVGDDGSEVEITAQGWGQHK